MSTRTTFTDAQLTGAAPARSARDWWRDAYDRLAGSDPGLSQLRTALQAVLGMSIAVVAAWQFVRLTGAMQISPVGLPAAVVSAQHHAVLVVGILLSVLTAMMASFVVNDVTPRGQLVTSVLLPVPMLAAITTGLALGRWHRTSEVFLAVVLMFAVYLRRFGPRGFAAGMVTFNGAFLGYFLESAIPLKNVGWVASELYLGVAVSVIVRFSLFRIDNPATLQRMRRSWVARARRLIGLAHELTDLDCDDKRRDVVAGRIQRQLIRLNESTLMIDGQLAQPAASSTAYLLHQRLFDMELAVSNLARFSVALSNRSLDPTLRAALRGVLSALRVDDMAEAAGQVGLMREQRPVDTTTAVLVDRFVQSVLAFSVARREWRQVADNPVGGASLAQSGESVTDADQAPEFTPAVGLFAGFLPGSAPVSEEAGSVRGKSRWFDSAVMPGYQRAAIQAGVAATIAIVVGGMLSERRLYWALLATFLAFLATNNSGEQVRKALFRAGGTAVGILIGDVSVHLVNGNLAATLVIIMVALFFGIYLIRINYMFMVIGITVAMSQLYVQLNEFSWHLLLLRLAETGIGVGAVVVTVLLVVPLRPQRVLTAGVLMYLRALATVTDRSLSTLLSGEQVSRADVRVLDAAHHGLITAAQPLRRATFGRNSSQLAEILAVASAARHYARNLAAGATAWPPSAATDALHAANGQLTASMTALVQRVETGQHGDYVRSAALFDLVDQALAPNSGAAQLVIRDLMLLDGALARLAAALQMDVRDHDTVSELVPQRAPLTPNTVTHTG